MTMNPQRRWEGAITNLNKGFKIDSKVGSYVPFPYLSSLLLLLAYLLSREEGVREEVVWARDEFISSGARTR